MAKRTRSAAERAAQAEGLRSRPARGRLLAAARELATAHGYEQLTVGELADRAGVSRETFYTHFAGKRACLAEAASPRLGEVEQLLRIATEEGEEWAPNLMEAVEQAVGDHFGSELTPRGRIADAMLEVVAAKGFASTRLADVIKAAHVSYPSFYRHYGSKEECFAAACAVRLERLELAVAEHRAVAATPVGPVATLAELLADDPAIARVLLIEAAELRGSSSFCELLERLLADWGPQASLPRSSRLLAGAVLEVFRTAVLLDKTAELPGRAAELSDLLQPPQHPRPARPRRSRSRRTSAHLAGAVS